MSIELKTIETYFWETKQDLSDQGIVDHLIAVFGVEDLGRDICMQGSFKKTLQERMNQIVVLDMHRHTSTLDAVGMPLKLWEVGRDGLPDEVLEMYPDATGGVRAQTQFLMDTPEGKGVFQRIKSGAVRSFSFGYDAVDFDYTEVKGRRVRQLRQIRLHEYGPTLFAMMPGARSIGAKSSDADAGGGARAGEGEGADVAADAGGGNGEGAEDERVEIGPNTITIRVKPSDQFVSDSFRVINVGDADNGIRARIGKIQGETSTTIQAYIFDKEKWTKEEAEEWVEEQLKSKSIFTVNVPKTFRVREAPSAKYLIVEQEVTGRFYKAEVNEAEVLTLVDQDLWVPGVYRFKEQLTLPPTSNAGDPDGSAKMVDLELELLELEF